ncbi:MAG: zinc-dependent peptidase, partial [Bacteroidota bacterium]
MSLSMLLVAGAVVAVYVIASALWSGYLGPFYYVRLKWRNAISRETYLERDAVLQQWNTFYKGLSTDGKGKFMRRMNRLIAERTFEGRQGLEVTEEMKIVIGSALTQLTFGLEYYDIYGFGLIHIYPEQFYSGMAKAELKGGTTPHGRIMLSWKDTKAGFADPHDRINLALHE